MVELLLIVPFSTTKFGLLTVLSMSSCVIITLIEDSDKPASTGLRCSETISSTLSIVAKVVFVPYLKS